MQSNRQNHREGVYLIIFFMAALFCLHPVAGAQMSSRWISKQWTVADGLPVNSVNAVIQGRAGYLWLATFDGLVRFDGLHFTVFRSSNDPELPSDRLTTLHQDQHGDLWMTTEQHHLVRFRDGRFLRFDVSDGLPDNHVIAWSEDSEGTLWFGTRSGVAKYSDNKLEAIAEALIATPVLAILHENDILWLGTEDRGLLRYANDELHSFGVAEGLPGMRVETVHRSGDGTLWVGTGKGLARFSVDHFEPMGERDGGSALFVLEVAEHPGGGFLAATREGLFRWNESGLEQISQSQGFTGAERLIATDGESRVINLGDRLLFDGKPIFSSTSGIKTVLIDREGGVWAGTTADGLFQIRRSLISNFGIPEGLPDDNLYPIAEGPPGVIWLGSNHGSLTRVTSGEAPAVLGPSFQAGGAVLSILPDGSGGAWFCGSGVWRIEPDGRVIQRGIDPLLKDEETRAIFRGASGEIWFGTFDSGLFRYEGQSWTRWTVEDGLPNAPIRVFAEDDEGSLWIGTNGAGLARLTSRGFETLSTAEGLPSDLIRALHVDSAGLLWVGTENRGLVRLDSRNMPLKEAEILRIRKSDGLFDDGLHQILDDGRGRFWMSTNRGLFTVSKAEIEAFLDGQIDKIHSLSFSESDGMRDREANGGVQSAGIVASDGRLWFPTQAGAVVIDPDELVINEVPPPVVIENVVIRGRRGTRKIVGAWDSAQPLRLTAGERDLEISYSGLSFVESEEVEFCYRLVGLRESWAPASTRRQATFTHLPPGEYRFEVKAANRDGVWNEQPAAVAIRVEAYFWETRWFFGLVVLGLIGAGIGKGIWRALLHRRRERDLEITVERRTQELAREHVRLREALVQVEEQATQLRELGEAKDHFFANVSHELRTPLTLLLGPLADAAEGDTEQLSSRSASMLRNARQLQAMIEQILDLQKISAGQLEFRRKPTGMTRLVQRVVHDFSAFAASCEVDLSFDAPHEELVCDVEAEQIETILANLLSNALKFTDRGGRVDVVCESHQAAEVLIRVSDTGRGIPSDALPSLFDRFFQVDASNTRARSGLGIGLSIASELARLHDGRLVASSQLGLGSTFTLSLPRSEVAAGSVEDLGRQIRGHLGSCTLPEPPQSGREAQGEGQNGAREDSRQVLIVDDHDDLRDYLRSILAPHYRLSEAKDGEEGLEVAREILPDLIVADVMMPKMTGFDLGRALRSDPILGGTPLLFLTARSSDEDVLEGFESGAVAFVTKPFTSALLLSQVKALLHQQERLRDRLRAASSTAETQDAQTQISPDFGPLESRLNVIIRSHLHDEDFSVERLAAEAATSRPTLYRQLRDEAGISPTGLIRKVRLERAAELLDSGAGSVSEVAYAVGFTTLSGFSKAYKGGFGVSPGAHLLDPDARKGKGCRN